MQKTFSLITLLLFIFIAQFSYSQTDTEGSKDKNREFGFHLGVNWNNPTVDEKEFVSSSRVGYQLGVFYRQGRYVYGETGLYYLHFSSDLASVSTSSIGPLNYSTIALPLLVGVRPIPSEQRVLNVRVFGGTWLGYVISGKYETQNLDYDAFKKFQLDPTIGAGVDVLLVHAAVGYAYGLSNILKDYKSHPNYLYLFLGLGF